MFKRANDVGTTGTRREVEFATHLVDEAVAQCTEYVALFPATAKEVGHRDNILLNISPFDPGVGQWRPEAGELVPDPEDKHHEYGEEHDSVGIDQEQRERVACHAMPASIVFVEDHFTCAIAGDETIRECCVVRDGETKVVEKGGFGDDGD